MTCLSIESYLTSNMAFYVGGMSYRTCTYHWEGGLAYILILPWSLMASQRLLLFLRTNTCNMLLNFMYTMQYAAELYIHHDFTYKMQYEKINHAISF